MSSKSIIIITLLLSVLCNTAYSQDVNTDRSIESLMIYNKWRLSNKRSYMNEEESIFRQSVFIDNLKKINANNANPKSTYTAGLNQFSDMTEEEFVSKILTNKINEQHGFQSEQPTKFSAGFAQSNSVDWRTKGAISSIKNQGTCGSCWTFATVALMESVNYIKNGKTTNFSEQQLLDCVNNQNGYASYGCGGGFPQQALVYAQKYGMVEESQYPYVGQVNYCRINQITQGFKPKTVYRIPSTQNDLRYALNQSPVSVNVDATNWQNYRSGVFSSCNTNTNHIVLAVGYDTYGNWIIKNSWGTNWGENGFVRLAAGNTCGVLSYLYNITV